MTFIRKLMPEPIHLRTSDYVFYVMLIALIVVFA